jgi:hypothetical protein
VLNINAFPITVVAVSAIIVAGVAGATATFFLAPLVTTAALGAVGFSAAGPVAGQPFYPSRIPCTHTAYRLYCSWPSGWNWKRCSRQSFCGCAKCGYGRDAHRRPHRRWYSLWRCRCRRCRCRGRGPLSSTDSCTVQYPAVVV